MKLDPAVLAAMSRQHDFRQSLAVTFRGDLDGIRAMSVLHSLDGVTFETEMIVVVVLGSLDWGNDRNRTQTVRLPIGFDWNERNFVALVERGVESIKVASESPLQALVTGRQKKQREATHSIMEAVLPMSLRREVMDWGLNMISFFDEEAVLPVIRVIINDGTDDVIDVMLCGWSGVIKVDGRYVAFCTTLKTAEQEIRKAFTAYLEKATAAA